MLSLDITLFISIVRKVGIRKKNLLYLWNDIAVQMIGNVKWRSIHELEGITDISLAKIDQTDFLPPPQPPLINLNILVIKEIVRLSDSTRGLHTD